MWIVFAGWIADSPSEHFTAEPALSWVSRIFCLPWFLRVPSLFNTFFKVKASHRFVPFHRIVSIQIKKEIIFYLEGILMSVLSYQRWISWHRSAAACCMCGWNRFSGVELSILLAGSGHVSHVELKTTPQLLLATWLPANMNTWHAANMNTWHAANMNTWLAANLNTWHAANLFGDIFPSGTSCADL